MQADLIIKNALLVDGSGAEPVRGHLAIKGDRIAALGDIPCPDDVPILDAAGRVLAPGFIDSHTHDDGYLLVHPDMTPKVSQGITSVVTGNCGISLAPLTRSDVPQPLDLLGPAELFRFATFAQWLEALRDAPAATNVIPLVGHTTLRVAVMGDAVDRAADADERQAMRELLDDALTAGSFEISTGMFYPPAAAAP